MKSLTNAQENLIAKGEKRGLFEIKDDKIRYLAQDKEYNLSRPEEPIRAATYAKLAFHWKYSPDRLDLEVYPPRREPKLPADIVVFRDRKRSKPYIVIECESSSNIEKEEEAKRQGLGNANLLLAEWLFTACGEEEKFYYVRDCSRARDLDKFERPDLPILYGKEPKYKFRKEGKDPEKVNLDTLHRKFGRCHDEIWEGGKRDPAQAFDEMSKLISAKIYDERFTKVGEYYKFQRGSNESPTVIGERVRKIYEKVQKKEPEVFKGEINVSDQIIEEVVDNLQDVSLIKTDLDAKGQAFEKFMGKIFRGEMGQFFTPREIIDFMVKFVDPDYTDLVMDPACGSSGFLLYAIKWIVEKAKNEYNEKSLERLTWDFSHDSVFGIEINDRISRIAMMDMVIHDDGHTNIECNDALIDYDKFDPKKDITPNKYDIILTNPPFSGTEKRKGILKNYELGSKRSQRKSQRKEILFIERSLDLVKEGGKIGIILPEGILNNSTLRYVRDWLKDKATILAVISLPTQAFKPYDGADKTSILFLEKGEFDDTPIFMAKAGHVGYDTTGGPDENDLPSILQEYRKFREHPTGYEGLKWESEWIAYSLDRRFLQDRLDSDYYRPDILERMKAIENSKYKVLDLADVIEDIDTGETFRRRDYSEKGEIFNVKVTNLTNEGIKWNKMSNYGSFTSGELYDENKNAQVKKGDILLTCSAHRPEYVGKDVAIVEGIPEKYNRKAMCSGEVMRIRPDDSKIVPEYLLFYLQSKLGQTQIRRILTGQTAHLYPDDMKKLFRVILPPLNKQKEVVALIQKKLDKRRELAKKASKLKGEIKEIYKDFLSVL